ncbi:MAG: ribosome biogenesis GTPase YlqF, partial [Oscillospiraceae bacterium]|nr:ribosome biogenesis GTPase YlqF [Oscillospiraceae bacterium]
SLHAKEALCARYKLNPDTDFEGDSYDLLEIVGRKRGMLQAGGSVNTERAAIMLLDEFRGSKLGAISLEAPEDRETF